MRTISINLSDPPRKLMAQVLNQLMLDQGTTRKPKLHAWQCRLYSHIIAHPDAQADELAAKYFETTAPFNRPHLIGSQDAFRKKMIAGAKAVGFTEEFPGTSA